MDQIFHEKSKYFTAVDLATIAQQLSDRDNIAVSNHMDDSGYFSLEVILKSLEAFNLKLYHFKDDIEEIAAYKRNPSEAVGFICHYGNHWLCLRKFADYWFDLNSMNKKPKLISKTYLTLYLAQLENENYHVFVVVGEFPVSEADAYFIENPIDVASQLLIDAQESAMISSPKVDDQDDPELAAALKESLQDLDGPGAQNSSMNDEEMQLNRAIEESLKEAGVAPSVQPTASPVTDPELVKRKRLEYFEKMNKN